MQSFPFDSKLTYDEHDNPIYDRAVSSQPLRKLIKELFTTGVMPNPSTNLQVSAGSDGMTVQIAAGFAVIDGGLCQETETRTLEVTAADNTYDRIDTVVLRWNENVDVRTADLYVIAGTPAVNPVRPTLQRNNSIYEIGLADVFITKRVATITNDKITDTRYEAERCGVVSSISEFDTTTLYQQIQADLTGFKSTEKANFLTWYENIQNILDENAAGHLQLEIDKLSTSVGDTDISDIGDGTVKGAIIQLNNDLPNNLEISNQILSLKHDNEVISSVSLPSSSAIKNKKSGTVNFNVSTSQSVSLGFTPNTSKTLVVHTDEITNGSSGWVTVYYSISGSTLTFTTSGYGVGNVQYQVIEFN